MKAWAKSMIYEVEPEGWMINGRGMLGADSIQDDPSMLGENWLHAQTWVPEGAGLAWKSGN